MLSLLITDGAAMSDGHEQDLSGKLASIIKMLLESIRACGWRGLLDLPMLVLLGLEMWRAHKAFAALVAAFRAGTLAPYPPAPEPQAAGAASPAAPRPAARIEPAARERRPQAGRRSRPAADDACRAAVVPQACRRAVVRPFR